LGRFQVIYASGVFKNSIFACANKIADFWHFRLFLSSFHLLLLIRQVSSRKREGVRQAGHLVEV